MYIYGINSEGYMDKISAVDVIRKANSSIIYSKEANNSKCLY